MALCHNLPVMEGLGKCTQRRERERERERECVCLRERQTERQRERERDSLLLTQRKTFISSEDHYIYEICVIVRSPKTTIKQTVAFKSEKKKKKKLKTNHNKNKTSSLINKCLRGNLIKDLKT